jgi:fumarate hydratase class II
MGEIRVPADARYGAQTQRAVENFPVSGLRMPRSFIRALGLIKGVCAEANQSIGLLSSAIAEAITAAATAVAAGRYDDDFPVDVFQTGSGTSSNMNANEVIAHLAAERLGQPVHPNDHVNLGQSSNDVVPSAIQVGACVEIEERLLPALRHLAATIEARAVECASIVKTGRTHLMDAMPLRLDQELGAWAHQVRAADRRISEALGRLRQLPLGGTAVGTGINAHPDFAVLAIERLAAAAGIAFEPAPDRFAGLSTPDAAVEMSGELKGLAVGLMKIANDLRWMNSGPLGGLGEIELPALQPGSSIMPGKVNPVIPEAVCMVCAQAMGNDVSVTVAGQSGNFQLNVMLPLVAHNLLQTIGLLSNASRLLADRAIAGFSVNEERLRAALDRNPVLVTALNRTLGYDLGAKIVKRAYAEGRSVMDIAREETDLDEAELRRLLDPAALTRGGLPG